MKNSLAASLAVLVFAIGSSAQQPSPAPRPTPLAPPSEPLNAEAQVKPASQVTPRKFDSIPPSDPPPRNFDYFGKKQSSYVRPDAKKRQKRYVNSIVGPFALGREVAGAGISTWRNSPEEWGDKWEGFGRRLASNFGKNVIKQTTIYGLDEALKYDSTFYRSKDKSVGARVRNALISPVTARDRNGKRVVGVPRLVGTYGSNIVAHEVWYPSRYGWKDGVRTGTISLGFNAAFNLFKEFVWKK